MPEPTPRQPPVTTTTRPGSGTGASFVAFGTALTLLRSGARRRREPTLSRLLTHRQMRYLNTADTRSPVTPDKRVTIDEIVGEIHDGMTIGIGGWGSRRKPMALVRALLRSPV